MTRSAEARGSRRARPTLVKDDEVGRGHGLPPRKNATEYRGRSAAAALRTAERPTSKNCQARGSLAGMMCVSEQRVLCASVVRGCLIEGFLGGCDITLGGKGVRDTKEDSSCPLA